MLFRPCFLFLALLVSLFYLSSFITTSFIFFFFFHRGRMPFLFCGKCKAGVVSHTACWGISPSSSVWFSIAELVLCSPPVSLDSLCILALGLQNRQWCPMFSLLVVCVCSHIHGGVLRCWFVNFVSTSSPWNLNLLGPTWSCGHDFSLYTVPFPRWGSLPGQAQSGPLRTQQSTL